MHLPQIPQETVRATRASAVRGRRRSAWSKARSHLRTTHPPRTTWRWGGQLHTLAASLPVKMSHIRSRGNRTVLREGSDDDLTYRRSAWSKARSQLRTTHPPRTTWRWGGQLHTLAASLPVKMSHIRSIGNRTVLREGSDDDPTYRDCASHSHSAQQIRGSEEKCHSPIYEWNTVYCTTETCPSLSLPHKQKRSRPLALRDSQRK